MSNFQEIVLKHLEDDQPDDYAELMRTRGLRDHMNALVDMLYEETERVQYKLQTTYPETCSNFLRIEAERIAIETLLPQTQ